jgi:hypothetical protein
MATADMLFTVSSVLALVLLSRFFYAAIFFKVSRGFLAKPMAVCMYHTAAGR